MEIKNIVSEETFLKLAEKKVRAEYCINDSTTFTSKINKKGNAVFRTEKGKEFVVSGLLSTKPNKYNGISPEFAEAILLSTFPSLKEKDYKFIFKGGSYRCEAPGREYVFRYIYKQPESHPVSGLPNGLDILPDGWVNLPSIDPYEILDSGEILDEYGNGFPDETVADEAVKKGDYSEEVVYLAKKDGIYSVLCMTALIEDIEFDGSFEPCLFKDEEKARSFFESYRETGASLQGAIAKREKFWKDVEEIKETTKDDRLYLKERDNTFGSDYCDIFFDHNLLIEYMYTFDKNLIIQEIKRYKKFEAELDERGYYILSITKRGEFPGNQRYYDFRFGGKEEKIIEKHIKSKMQHRMRRTLDYISAEEVADASALSSCKSKKSLED